MASVALNAAITAHGAVVKHVFVLKLAAIAERVPGFLGVAIEREGANDDQGRHVPRVSRAWAM